MSIATINPTNGECVREFSAHSAQQIETILSGVQLATRAWQDLNVAARAAPLRAAAQVLRKGSNDYARLMAVEMGKPVREARAEIEKCAWACEFYAEHAAAFLADEAIATDAARSYVSYPPLGTVLAVMPWNFPFWQVFRCAAPALMAGNTVILKHASNVPQCALAIEDIFRRAQFPPDVFRVMLIAGAAVDDLIRDTRIHAVSLTGSEAAGARVAASAGAAIKKTVLELGGSDAFVVLADADLEQAAHVAVSSRYLNAGQSCIAAKRLIVEASIADDFVRRFRSHAEALVQGDPLSEDTQIGPLARRDLRDALHQQVQDSIRQGAQVLLGCTLPEGRGAYYPVSILDRVRPGMRAHDEELFGPVAVVLRATDEDDALRLANHHRYGLGGSVWTRDRTRGERFARRLQSGAAFVNGMVKSDPRLPFGGIKASGYGRELSVHGIREFVNTKTVWIK